MAANTSISPEEKQRPQILQRPDYAPPAPTAMYEGSEYEDVLQRRINEWAAMADQKKQAEDDARIQRGKNFWTGANLFANVIANAINAHGTANGAPNMTWNDASSQKMYETWQNADKELKADRKAAQQRLEALQMQDASMRFADRKAADAAAQEAYKAEYAKQVAATDALNSQNLSDYEFDRAEKAKSAKEDREDERWKERNRIKYGQDVRLAQIRNAGKGEKPTDHSVTVGSVDIPAKDKKEAERIRKDIAFKIVARVNAGKKTLEKPEENPKNDKEAQEIIYQYGSLYDDDAEFRKEINNAYGIDDIYDEQETAGEGRRHWMDVPMGNPTPYTPGYVPDDFANRQNVPAYQPTDRNGNPNAGKKGNPNKVKFNF